MNHDLEELRDFFTACDTNEDGRIQYDEFVQLLKNLGTDMGSEECRIGFGDVDTDRDGVVDFKEFVAWWSEL